MRWRVVARHSVRRAASEGANTDVVTPNNDTPYSWGWLDLRAEPWVVSVPAVDRYYVLPFWDLDTTFVGFVGSRTTGSGPGDHLIAGPGWDGDVPDGIGTVMRADTEIVGILGRTYLAGPDDVGTLRALQGQYVLRPLHEYTGAGAPAPAPTPDWPEWDESMVDGPAALAVLDRLLRFFPVLPDEAGIRGRMADLGLDGRGTFDPAALAPEVRDALEQGIADGRARLDEALARTDRSDHLFGTREQMGHRYLDRAVAANKGLYGLPSDEALYTGWLTDARGRPLDASSTGYTITFHGGQLPPARFFWSATLYRLPERLLAANPIDRYSIGDRTPGLTYADDGSLTIHVRHERPDDPDEAANWLPAPAGPFTVIIRLYGPDPAALDGTWTLPPISPHP